MSEYVFARNGMGNYTTGTGMREDMLMQPFNQWIQQAGVVLIDDLIVSENGAGADMSVDVAPGRCFVTNSSYIVNTANKTKYWGVLSDSTLNLAVDTNTSGSTRIDLVCVKIDTSLSPNDYATNVASRLIVKGTPGAGQPATPNNHLLLATITIPTGTTTAIDSGMIADVRTFARINASYVSVVNNDEGLKGLLSTGELDNLFSIVNDKPTMPLGVDVADHLTLLDYGGSGTLMRITVDSNHNIIHYDTSGYIYKIIVPLTGSISAAFTSISSSGKGGIVQLMSGHYTIHAGLTIPSGVIFQGAGLNQSYIDIDTGVTTYITMSSSSIFRDIFLTKTNSVQVTNWINVNAGCLVSIKANNIGYGGYNENMIVGSPDGSEIQIYGFQFASGAGASSTILPSTAAPVYCIFHLTETSGSTAHRNLNFGASTVKNFAVVRHQGSTSDTGSGNVINPT